jgi:RsiW-degrading membrane proteinase PrsW (M82 family)
MTSAYWIRLTYSRRFLKRLTIVCFVLTVVGAFAVDKLHVKLMGEEVRQMQMANEQWLEWSLNDFEDDLLYLSIDFPEKITPESATQFIKDLPVDEMFEFALFASRYPESEDRLLIDEIFKLDSSVHPQWPLYHAFWESINSDAPQISKAFEAMLANEPVERYVHYAQGVFYEDNEQSEQAIESYLLEVEAYNWDVARRDAVYLAFDTRQWDVLAKWLNDPGFSACFDASDYVAIHAAHQHWWQVFTGLPKSLWGDLEWWLVVLAVLTGSSWFIFLVKASQPEGQWLKRILICLVAVALGVLSVWPTVFLDYWQEQVWGLIEDQSNPGSLVIYYIAGVGLREELAKTLFVLPLVPFIARRDAGLNMLLIPACVGLGFAMEENMQYYYDSMMGDVVGRFITANILHMVITGIVGMELCWLWLDPRGRLQSFLLTFVLAIVFHGIYDVVLDLADDYTMSMASILVLLFLVYHFFQYLREYRKPQQRGVSLIFIYIVGIFISIWTMVFMQSWMLGPELAFGLFLSDGVLLVVMSILLIRQMPTVLIA